LKHRSVVCAAGALLLLSAVASPAEPIRHAQVDAALPPHEVLTIVRSAGFQPIGRPARDGDNYVLRAVDRYGQDVQVIVDAEDADILFVRRLGSVAPRYDRATPTDFAGPRLGHAPRYPDFFGNVPRPPRAVPGSRTPARAGPPLPRPRPGEVTASVKTEPAAPASPPPSQEPSQAKPDVPPVVGFE
jgi:hypothetical protein